MTADTAHCSCGDLDQPGLLQCRTATKALDEAGVAYTVRRYLDDPPTAAELTDVLSRLNLEPWDPGPLERTRRQAPSATSPATPPTADDATTTIARRSETLSKFLP